MYRSVVVATALGFAVALSSAASATPSFPSFNPTDLMSLGTANISGAATVNTDTFTMSGFTGIQDHGFAVFDFANFTIDAGASLVATGSNPLAILSRNRIDILGTLDLSALDQVELVATSFDVPLGAMIILHDVSSLEIDTLGSSLGAAAVPEPGSGLLFASMLFGWRLVGKRRSRPRHLSKIS